VTDDGQKQMVTGHITILRDGNEIADARRAGSSGNTEQEPTARSPSDGRQATIHIVLGIQPGDQSASLQVVINRW
jgi:hypothetical protein